VVRHEERRILDRRDEIATALEREIEAVSDYDEPRVALVFNSARDSNDFHTFLAEEYPTVFDHAEKDNGFDTNDPQVTLEESAFYILNTTSKGEVGLDYDIETLHMENPGKPGKFLQRFGRAGRESEAEVHVYGLGQGPWGDDVAFSTFEQQIYEGLSEERMAEEWLADLIGFRAAYALAVREADDGWFNRELRADFAENVERFNRWRGFIASINEELEYVGGFGGKYTERSTEAKLLGFTEQCFEAFRGLRGRSLPAEIKYPRGDRLGLTTYDLVTTLRNYDIDHIEDGSILVLKTKDEESLSVVTARLPEFESEPTKYDQPTPEIEDTLQTKIRRKIDEVGLNEDFEVSTELLHRFYQIVRITNAVVPSRITTASFEIDVDTDGGGPPSITPRRRQL
jgi:CRISPR-associated endonuclease/helicase Cas3